MAWLILLFFPRRLRMTGMPFFFVGLSYCGTLLLSLHWFSLFRHQTMGARSYTIYLPRASWLLGHNYNYTRPWLAINCFPPPLLPQFSARKKLPFSIQRPTKPLIRHLLLVCFSSFCGRKPLPSFLFPLRLL